jgi:uncharacterized membrane protein
VSLSRRDFTTRCSDSVVTARRTLLGVAILFSVGEALDSISVGVVGIVFALLFAVGAVLMYRGSRFGVPLVGVLVLVEVAAWPTFTRDTATDWIIQVPFLIVGLVGLAALGVIVFRGLRTRRGRAATSSS